MNPSESEITAWLNRNSRQAFRNGKKTKAMIRRRLEASAQDIWAACTNRETLGLWFGEVKGDISPGATVKFDFEIPQLVASEIKICIPMERLLISWRYEGHAEDHVDEVELRLEPAGAATDMILEHRSEHGTDPAGVGPGWDSWLFRLTELLGGVERPEFSEALETVAAKIWGETGTLDNGPFYHGTKADLRVGDLLTAGFRSNYKPEIVMNHIYFAALPNGAGLAAALAAGDGRERVYIVEPTGAFENDPNVTDKKFPGNPTRSYRSQAPLKIVGEATDWLRQTPDELRIWRERLAKIKADARAEIIN